MKENGNINEMSGCADSQSAKTQMVRHMWLVWLTGVSCSYPNSTYFFFAVEYITVANADRIRDSAFGPHERSTNALYAIVQLYNTVYYRLAAICRVILDKYFSLGCVR